MEATKNLEWKKVWSNRKIDLNILNISKDINTIFLELKRINGFDVAEGLDMDSLVEQWRQITKEINFTIKENTDRVKSVFEVGCGSGANLYLYEKSGYHVGGLDYSTSLVKTAKEVLVSEDIVCDEAININIYPQYDTVISNSVFSYFPDLEYATVVLDKMIKKSIRSVAIIDIHDLRLKKEFVDCRKQLIKDYEERYKNLPKLFYPKSFFIEFAEKNNLDVKFSLSDIRGYWNNPFVYSCFYYKR